ncbi:MAG: FadR/GntR family transcriptional regulator [Blastocatellia bacterium]
MIKTVMREANLTQRAQSQLEELIVNGSLLVGERLPSERELIEQLGVSKTVVREAMRSLATRGLIEIRPGSGMYVVGVGAHLMAEPISLLMRKHRLTVKQIHEVREALEIRIVALAAERAQKEDIEAMAESIRQLEEPRLTPLRYAQLDVEFHTRLAAAAGNPLFSFLINSINDVMLEVRKRAFNLGKRNFVAHSIGEHSKVLKCVEAGDVRGAQKAMAEHLELGSARLMDAEKLLREART